MGGGFFGRSRPVSKVPQVPKGIGAGIAENYGIAVALNFRSEIQVVVGIDDDHLYRIGQYTA